MDNNEIKKRGSEWRKWDLHVHTPESIFHEYKAKGTDDVWETYIKDLESLKDIKVLGINDYLFIDGYKKVLEYKKSGRLKNIDLILPVIEFRLAKFCGNKQWKRINYHVIFSDKIDADVIQSQFLNGLSAKYKLDPNCDQHQWGGVVTKENLKNLGKAIKKSVPENELKNYGSDIIEGFNNLNLDVDQIREVLNNASQFFKGKYLTCIGKTEWDSLDWNDNSIAEKKNIINSVDIVFTASESIENFNKAKKKLVESKVNSLLLDCSDAHRNSNDSNKDRLGNCSTWIKADTTFEGLKQILYEQETRIKVQETKPEEKLGYNVIDYIELPQQDFNKQKIYFNQNLNTIIGGRSTGKSTLLKLLHYKTDKFGDKPESYLSNLIDNTNVSWINEHVGDAPEIQYFPQGYMHELSLPEKSNEFDKVVRDIIQQKEFGEKLIQYDNEIQTQSSVIIQKITSLFLKEKEIFNKEEEIKKLGSSSAILQEIENIKKRISESVSVTNAQELQESIDKHSSLCEQINSIQKKIDSLNKLSKTLESIQESQIISENIFTMFNFLDAECDIINIKESFDSLTQKIKNDFSKWINDNLGLITKLMQDAESEKQQIIDCEDYKKGEALIKQNKIVEDLNFKLKEENSKVGKVQLLEKDRNKTIEQKNNLINEIVDLYLLIINNGKQYCEEFNQQGSIDNIKINAGLIIKEKSLKEFYEDRFNLRSIDNLKTDDFIEFYHSNEKEQYVNFLKGLSSGDYVLKNNHNFQNVASELFGQCWYSIKYDVVYQGDNFREMSPGKQAFVVLKLLLDFSNNKCPILIDQPEDSLDNRAIYNELVSYIKKKKTERQIILVTHNANIVVGADAENVIVANQKGKDSKNFNDVKFQYLSGPLENTKSLDKDCETTLEKQGIREHVCEILEGGQDAFDIREKKYGFK